MLGFNMYEGMDEDTPENRAHLRAKHVQNFHKSIALMGGEFVQQMPTDETLLEVLNEYERQYQGAGSGHQRVIMRLFFEMGIGVTNPNDMYRGARKMRLGIGNQKRKN